MGCHWEEAKCSSNYKVCIWFIELATSVFIGNLYWAIIYVGWHRNHLSCAKTLSNPQLNHISTQPSITLSWVRYENDFAHHPTPPHPPPHTNSMLEISQLLLTRFLWNFKCRFLGTSRTDHNCHGDICPGNIYQGGICPYHKYLNWKWHNLDLTF